jgi:hypothetical protein
MSRPGSLRDRELRALKRGLQALAEGREEELDGKRLGYSPSHHDLRDCAELKIPVIPESRYGNDLGPSHRLVYREFEPEDGGLPYREVVCFEPRDADRPLRSPAPASSARLAAQARISPTSRSTAPGSDAVPPNPQALRAGLFHLISARRWPRPPGWLIRRGPRFRGRAVGRRPWSRGAGVRLAGRFERPRRGRPGDDGFRGRRPR